jgi:rare lipoprotein A (peptidoglycan hydrolase)
VASASAARSHHRATGGVAPLAPSETAAKVHASGIATWFGPGFYGKKTACGQTLTPAVIGVANRTLPCGTLVKVSYAGHALVVPVLDRGPYSHIGADWDLTAGAATALGISDTVRIGTRIVGSAPNGPTLGAPRGGAAAGLAGGALAG